MAGSGLKARSIKLSNISAIQKAPGTVISEKSKIIELVDPPLVKACEFLYDINLQTIVASANKRNVGLGRAYVGIARDSLSVENRDIADKLAASEAKGIYYLVFPVNKDSTHGHVEDASLSVVKKFLKQDFDWCPRFTLDEMKKKYGITPGDEDYEKWGISDFKKQTKYYYDPNSERFFQSREHFQKFLKGEQEWGR